MAAQPSGATAEVMPKRGKSKPLLGAMHVSGRNAGQIAVAQAAAVSRGPKCKLPGTKKYSEPR